MCVHVLSDATWTTGSSLYRRTGNGGRNIPRNGMSLNIPFTRISSTTIGTAYSDAFKIFCSYVENYSVLVTPSCRYNVTKKNKEKINGQSILNLYDYPFQTSFLVSYTGQKEVTKRNCSSGFILFNVRYCSPIEVIRGKSLGLAVPIVEQLGVFRNPMMVRWGVPRPIAWSYDNKT